MVTTIGRWIDLPTSGGAADPFALDLPDSSGLFQIAASNATHAARENNLRTLWEDFGSDTVFTDLFTSGDVGTFQWDVEDADGTYARFAGVHRVRLHGETRQLPRLHLSCRGFTPATYTTGVILLVLPAFGVPSARTGLYGTTTTTSTTVTDLSITLSLTPEALGLDPLAFGDGALVEAGAMTSCAVWVGAWNTSGSSGAKGALYGVTLSLREP